MKERIISSIEGLLLVANKELTVRRLVEILEVKKEDIIEAIEALKQKYNQKNSGIHLTINNEKIQFTTNPDNTEIIKKFLNEEEKGELTKPSLETLTIIAYRQPVSKQEIEQIRGVNCSLILRNLMIRGLVEAKEDSQKMEIYYSVTLDFLKYLGINQVSELPDFEKLNSDENLQKLLRQKEEGQTKINI